MENLECGGLMESIKNDPRVEGLVRDLRSTIERLQERLKVVEDRVERARQTLVFGPYFALPTLPTPDIVPPSEDGNMVYNRTTNEVWVKINGALRSINTSPV
jgi:hypothetical protein